LFLNWLVQKAGTGGPAGTRDYSLSALGLKTFTEMKDLPSTVKENTSCWTSERLASAISQSTFGAA